MKSAYTHLLDTTRRPSSVLVFFITFNIPLSLKYFLISLKLDSIKSLTENSPASSPSVGSARALNFFHSTLIFTSS